MKQSEKSMLPRSNIKYEEQLLEEGYHLIAGIDEVGRGPLIGPVVAACVILKEHEFLEGVTDSKKLSEKKREQYYEIIMENAVSVGIGIISPATIDEVNIYQATILAMKEAVKNCKIKPDYILVDGNMKIDFEIPSKSIVKGDQLSLTIAAASIIAKVTRDRMLIELDGQYPMYGFKNHKGYPTKQHLEAIQKYGLIEGYRKSFKPVQEIMIQDEKNCITNQ